MKRGWLAVALMLLAGVTQAAIVSHIEGTFNGWSGNTIVQLTNGTVWKQTDWEYSYSYAYAPKVIIYEGPLGPTMHVAGNSLDVPVEQLP